MIMADWFALLRVGYGYTMRARSASRSSTSERAARAVRVLTSAQRESSEYMRARSASRPSTDERAARVFRVHSSAQREPFKYRRTRSASRTSTCERAARAIRVHASAQREPSEYMRARSAVRSSRRILKLDQNLIKFRVLIEEKFADSKTITTCELRHSSFCATRVTRARLYQVADGRAETAAADPAHIRASPEWPQWFSFQCQGAEPP